MVWKHRGWGDIILTGAEHFKLVSERESPFSRQRGKDLPRTQSRTGTELENGVRATFQSIGMAELAKTNVDLRITILHIYKLRHRFNWFSLQLLSQRRGNSPGKLLLPSQNFRPFVVENLD